MTTALTKTICARVLQLFITKTTTLTAVRCQGSSKQSNQVSTSVEIEAGPVLQLIMTLSSTVSAGALDVIARTTAEALSVDVRRVTPSFLSVRRQAQAGNVVQVNVLAQSVTDAEMLKFNSERKLYSALYSAGVATKEILANVMQPDTNTGSLGLLGQLPSGQGAGPDFGATVALGVGLGLGLPLLLITIALFVYWRYLKSTRAQSYKASPVSGFDAHVSGAVAFQHPDGLEPLEPPSVYTTYQSQVPPSPFIPRSGGRHATPSISGDSYFPSPSVPIHTSVRTSPEDSTQAAAIPDGLKLNFGMTAAWINAKASSSGQLTPRTAALSVSSFGPSLDLAAIQNQTQAQGETSNMSMVSTPRHLSPPAPLSGNSNSLLFTPEEQPGNIVTQGRAWQAVTPPLRPIMMPIHRKNVIHTKLQSLIRYGSAASMRVAPKVSLLPRLIQRPQVYMVEQLEVSNDVCLTVSQPATDNLHGGVMYQPQRESDKIALEQRMLPVVQKRVLPVLSVQTRRSKGAYAMQPTYYYPSPPV
jgi:hypothetical protein